MIKHVTNMRAGCTSFVIALEFSLTSIHSVAVGYAILCSQRGILVNTNASMVTLIEICANCPSYFATLTNTTLNRLGFGMLTRWISYVLIVYLLIYSSSRDR